MLLNPAEKKDNSKEAVIILKSANVKWMNENSMYLTLDCMPMVC